MVVRFGVGAATSALAGELSVLAGPFIGGVFLAFPASLTLVADEEGRSKILDGARGKPAGALGLIAFPAVGAALFSHEVPLVASVLAPLVSVLAGLGVPDCRAYRMRLGERE